MKDSTSGFFKNRLQVKKNQSFLAGETANPKGLPFFSERKNAGIRLDSSTFWS